MTFFDINKIMKGSPPPIEYQVTLDNWRKYPFNSWSFVNVRNLIPTSPIYNNPDKEVILQKQLIDIDDLVIDHKNTSYKLKEIFKICDTDAFLVMHKGKIKFEFYDKFTRFNTPHIIFSVSKSLTSLLTGILVEKKVININNYISHILPETKGTAYEDATVRNVLDMSIASGFIEDYTGQAEIFKKYRSSTGWDLPETNSKQTVKGLHDFLSSMPKSNQKHGKKYHYCSPHSDLLGWIIERASGENYSKIMADLLFKKAGINHEANVTVDKWGASRAAGGISVSPYDLLLLSELVRNHGSNKNGQVIPAAWIEDFVNNKNNNSYLNQDNLERFPNGNYRSKWYQTGFKDNEYCAIGIHGQNIWINPQKEITIVRMSSASDPINIKTEELMFSVFDEISKIFI
jgi:CubicO group peptidase (beta-lactamase class C family)